mmetsp:Transcript_15040/g.28582  ORF Transcript_15040/g.28582 Transcript_15040/m.28582 type:complete len:274 (-) Transcript_15040:655-1476(-)
MPKTRSRRGMRMSAGALPEEKEDQRVMVRFASVPVRNGGVMEFFEFVESSYCERKSTRVTHLDCTGEAAVDVTSNCARHRMKNDGNSPPPAPSAPPAVEVRVEVKSHNLTLPSSCPVSTCLASLLLHAKSFAPATVKLSPSSASSAVTLSGIMPGTPAMGEPPGRPPAGAPVGSRSSQSQTMWDSVSWGRVTRRVVSTRVATVLPPWAASLSPFPLFILRCSNRNRLGLNGCHTSRLASPNRTSSNLSAPNTPAPPVTLLLLEEWRRHIKIEA